MRPFTTRLALRKIRREHPECRKDINTLLRDGDMLGMLGEEVEGIVGGKVGGALDWFTYLIENWEEIWKIIQLIITLFEEGTP